MRGSVSLEPRGPGLTLTEGCYRDTWRQISARNDLDDGCACSEDIDSSVALSWRRTLAPGSSQVMSSEISLHRP